MPKTKFQTIIFTLLMSFAMVYVMICYNIALAKGGMSNEIFLFAFRELLIMWPAAFLLELLVVDKLAHLLAFRIVKHDDRPIFIILAMSSIIVCLMCPLMSLLATLLFKSPGSEIIAIWLQTTVHNFPMAFFCQIFFVGPFIRFLFGSIFKSKH